MFEEMYCEGDNYLVWRV